MKLLVLGANGMAGHVMVKHFLQNPSYSVHYTTRNRKDVQGLYLDACNEQQLESLMEIVSPDITINCIGILNEDAAKREDDALIINGLLPHWLRRMAEKNGGRLIHISTDCVFSGDKGDYQENDSPDGISVYAKTKAMGDVRSDLHLTIRTSIIGPEQREGIGLFHWFMKQQGAVYGYRKVMWNGVTTIQLAKSIERMIEENVTGLYHLVAPRKISKYELLRLMKREFGKTDISIIPLDHPVQDRTLMNTRTDFLAEVPDYPVMIAEMREWMEGAI
ncbi:MAG: SDR family oxidoreductase [Gorillibacterium sp.]|nr:SDR family oxidoreductase [Gorillibacterium sp.]